ncbi:MAG: hypothetical protein ACRCTL_17715 [Pseudomonas sp.]
MSKAKSAALVRRAIAAKGGLISESMEGFPALGKALDSRGLIDFLSPWEKALSDANQHITVKPEEIEAAADGYHQVAQLLVNKLHWPDSAIKIKPQGSASTKTLIRSPNGGEKFDIDAVCEVDINRIDAHEPMKFFESVGQALQSLGAERKKRCWNIPFNSHPFYLEFTPSVPLATVPRESVDAMKPRYRSAPGYDSTALAVVDTPTKLWKTSNPDGMTQWVEDTSKTALILKATMEAYAQDQRRADVAPVPGQEVEITDTLRVAIRLFKRHRDMCVRRELIDKEFKPISIIIVTLLTSCYEGLAQEGVAFNHPVEVLEMLARLLPEMIDRVGDEYRVDNPTVDGENFAEKWNQDNGERKNAFNTWCKKLQADLKAILALKDPAEIVSRVREVFGIPAPTTGGNGHGTPGGNSHRPVQRPAAPSKIPVRGLA